MNHLIRCTSRLKYFGNNPFNKARCGWGYDDWFVEQTAAPLGQVEPDAATSDLIDAMSIFTVPVVLGGGKKLFADGSVAPSYPLAFRRFPKRKLYC